MAILVTGGAGYIGSHTCVELLDAGYEIVVLDNFSNSSPEALKRVAEMTETNFSTYPFDLMHKEKLKRVFSENRIDAVVHFAGLKSVSESVVHPLEYYQNNLAGTLNLCEVMDHYGVKKLVFSSSATVYGTTDNVPLTEDAKLSAINPYGRTKLMIEEMLADLHRSDPTWGIAVLRYFNPIGAHRSGHIGEDPRGIPNNLLPYIAQVAIGKQQRLLIFGNDYPTKDGTGVRDYIHVTDLAVGHLRALEKIQSEPGGIAAYNLGTGSGYSVLEIVEAFEKVSGVTVPYTITKRRSGDTAISYANPAKANKELNWQATRGIETMCEDVWRWQQHNPHGYARGEVESIAWK
ncbi:UDP-glucose 4-epimerase GalE [Lentibacillus sp. N15]|uniref:UDP-glucose 4-epimerase GalE n=1 Tax=Lentibacillus songyuanensis TaxID=3136161 RepID=UPI0031B9DA03